MLAKNGDYPCTSVDAPLYTLQIGNNMKTLAQLNKLNQEGVEAIRTSSTFKENLYRGKPYLQDAALYRNKLLKSMEGETVTIKGYVIAEFHKDNFTIACAEVYYKGKLVDTLHHLNVYIDLLNRRYSTQELVTSVSGCQDDNLAPVEALFVEIQGLVYSYGNKYSVGTRRQVAYAKRKFAA